MIAADDSGRERAGSETRDAEARPVQGRPSPEVMDPAYAVPDKTSGNERDAGRLKRKATWVLPEDFISRCTSVVLLLCLYSALCILLPTTLGVRANPAVMPEGSKPAWNFLFLYEYVRLVPSFVGALTPALLLVLLGAWPFLDRNPSRNPRTRIFALLLAFAVVAGILTLTYIGWVE